MLVKLWFPYVRRVERPRHRLFCLHHAGGSAAAFTPWIEPLARHGVEVWALQLPGRENRWGERPFEDMTTAARASASAMFPHVDVPYALFGHSIGAKLAFAVAHVLAGTAAPSPARLILSAARAPSCREDDDFIRHDQSADDLVRSLERMGGTPSELLAHPEFVEFMLPALRADLRLNASSHMVGSTPLEVPLHVFGGIDDGDVTRDQLAAWLSCTRAPGQVQQLPGGHFFLFAADSAMPERIARLLCADPPLRPD
jgi:medium-chain acyl-[acyl-carrier-protein] hydrolase